MEKCCGGRIEYRHEAGGGGRVAGTIYRKAHERWIKQGMGMRWEA